MPPCFSISHLMSVCSPSCFMLSSSVPGKMPEFVIQDVLSGGYQYNTHVDVIAIKEHSSREAGERNGIWAFLVLG